MSTIITFEKMLKKKTTTIMKSCESLILTRRVDNTKKIQKRTKHCQQPSSHKDEQKKKKPTLQMTTKYHEEVLTYR
jgi:hypothetical protein